MTHVQTCSKKIVCIDFLILQTWGYFAEIIVTATDSFLCCYANVKKGGGHQKHANVKDCIVEGFLHMLLSKTNYICGFPKVFYSYKNDPGVLKNLMIL